ncbi:MerR family transcriptional regulator [Longispora sp. NPDC051575]|uniref:MerR family transcriptional regulator n=1 Tax=Longispora sp. NPDC051575 TaxID=3154943 RepID=UPI003429598E
MLQIGEVATRTGLSLRTIRHYDEAELVVPSARSQGGFRLYTDADVERLLVIKRMKPLGFTLEEMRQLLETLATLTAPELPDLEASALRRRLNGFHEAAEARCEALRTELAMAEEFAAVLTAQLQRTSAGPAVADA